MDFTDFILNWNDTQFVDERKTDKKAYSDWYDSIIGDIDSIQTEKDINKHSGTDRNADAKATVSNSS